MWRNRHTPPVPDDLEEAQAIREEAITDLITIQRQAPYVKRLTNRLIMRREENHFGDQIQVTFTPRGNNV